MNPYEQNEEVTKDLVKTVNGLRESMDVLSQLKPPHISESMRDLHERLLLTRAVQQRVSEIVGNLLLTQSGVKKLVLDRRSDLAIAEAEAISTPKNAFVEDWSSAKEKNAKLTAKTLDERIALSAAEKLQVDVDAALAFAQNTYKELGNKVFDVNSRIKILGMEGTWS